MERSLARAHVALASGRGLLGPHFEVVLWISIW
jgi:hypothetical protein